MNVWGDFLGSPHGTNTTGVVCKKGKRSGSVTITNRSPPQTPRGRETEKSKQAQIKQTYEKHFFFLKRVNRNAKRTEKHKNKMTQGINKSSPRINHKATKSKTNTGTTALE